MNLLIEQSKLGDDHYTKKLINIYLALLPQNCIPSFNGNTSMI